jgi:hypothetical protein
VPRCRWRVSPAGAHGHTHAHACGWGRSVDSHAQWNAFPTSLVRADPPTTTTSPRLRSAHVPAPAPGAHRGDGQRRGYRRKSPAGAGRRHQQVVAARSHSDAYGAHDAAARGAWCNRCRRADDEGRRAGDRKGHCVGQRVSQGHRHGDAAASHGGRGQAGHGRHRGGRLQRHNSTCSRHKGTTCGGRHTCELVSALAGRQAPLSKGASRATGPAAPRSPGVGSPQRRLSCTPRRHSPR